MVKTKTYYSQIKEIVNPYLEHYRNDLLVHDKETLRGYTGRFMYFFRPSGTHISLMDNKAWYTRQSGFTTPKDLKELLLSKVQFNKRFIIGEKGTVREVNREEMLEAIQEHVKWYENEYTSWRIEDVFMEEYSSGVWVAEDRYTGYEWEYNARTKTLTRIDYNGDKEFQTRIDQPYPCIENYIYCLNYKKKIKEGK